MKWLDLRYITYKLWTHDSYLISKSPEHVAFSTVTLLGVGAQLSLVKCSHFSSDLEQPGLDFCSQQKKFSLFSKVLASLQLGQSIQRLCNPWICFSETQDWNKKNAWSLAWVKVSFEMDTGIGGSKYLSLRPPGSATCIASHCNYLG